MTCRPTWMAIGRISRIHGKLKSLNYLNSFALNKLATKKLARGQGRSTACSFSLKYFVTIAIHCPQYSTGSLVGTRLQPPCCKYCNHHTAGIAGEISHINTVKWGLFKSRVIPPKNCQCHGKQYDQPWEFKGFPWLPHHFPSASRLPQPLSGWKCILQATGHV
jgi:hypothetical protein